MRRSYTKVVDSDLGRVGLGDPPNWGDICRLRIILEPVICFRLCCDQEKMANKYW